jgi:hypothetical protein
MILDRIQERVPLRRVASTNGGEWAGPCPFCGGIDRLRCWPNADGKGRFWCRKCGKHGDEIDFLRLTEGIGYLEACKKLQIFPSTSRRLPRASNWWRKRPESKGALVKDPAPIPDNLGVPTERAAELERPEAVSRYDCWGGCPYFYRRVDVWECRTLDGNHDLKNPDFVCPKTQAGFRYCLPRDMWPVEDQ